MEENKTATWEVRAMNDTMFRKTGRQLITCTNCRNSAKVMFYEKKPKYCGECGAKMEGYKWVT